MSLCSADLNHMAAGPCDKKESYLWLFSSKGILCLSKDKEEKWEGKYVCGAGDVITGRTNESS